MTRRMNGQKPLTTGQVARLLRVSSSTVINLFDDNAFAHGFRTPGDTLSHRRIPMEDVLKVAQESGISNEELHGRLLTNIFIFSKDETIGEVFPKEVFRVSRANSMFDAGMTVIEYRPDCVVVDFATINLKELITISAILQDVLGMKPFYVVLSPSGSAIRALQRAGVFINKFIEKPVEPALLLAEVERVFLS